MIFNYVQSYTFFSYNQIYLRKKHTKKHHNEEMPILHNLDG